MTPHIRKLSSSVRSKLRSGINITSISQCVEELVLNAVDSGATNIAIRVDLSIYRIQIVDNGHGIPEEDLRLIGTRYATSKCHNLEDLNCNITKYGFRGEALASIIHMSGIVDISSKHRKSSKTFEKLFTYGNAKSPSVCKHNRPSFGTTITIQDFMYNMPVRRKLIKESIDLEIMKSQIERIMLITPAVSVTLKNERVNCNILEIHKNKSLLEAFLQIFGNEHEKNMAEVYHSFDQFEIRGYISTQPHQTKRLQFIYINKRSVIHTKIHALMNDLLSRSSIIRSKISNTNFLGSGKIPSSPPKGLKFYGIFVLNITCPRNEYDICLEPKKTLVEFGDWEKLLTCVEELVLKFIKEENLTISLDDRFRKSEKEVFPTELETRTPHSSQTVLQAFSNTKERGIKEDPKYDNPLQKKITISDVKSAVHSLPARRNTNSTVNDNKNVDSCDAEKRKSEVQENDKIHSKSKRCSDFSSLKSARNCDRDSDKQLSSLQALKHIHSKVEKSDKFIQDTGKKSNESEKIDSHISSIQELKLANSKSIKDSFITPSNKIIPSVYPSRVNQSLDETYDIYNENQNFSKTKNLKPESSVSYTLGKQYKEVIKKKSVLNCLQNFQFNKTDRPSKHKLEGKTVDVLNKTRIHIASNNKSDVQPSIAINKCLLPKSKPINFFDANAIEDSSLDDINVNDLLFGKTKFFNFENGVRENEGSIKAVESNHSDHRKDFNGNEARKMSLHCGGKITTRLNVDKNKADYLLNLKGKDFFIPNNNKSDDSCNTHNLISLSQNILGNDCKTNGKKFSSINGSTQPFNAQSNKTSNGLNFDNGMISNHKTHTQPFNIESQIPSRSAESGTCEELNIINEFPNIEVNLEIEAGNQAEDSQEKYILSPPSSSDDIKKNKSESCTNNYNIKGSTLLANNDGMSPSSNSVVLSEEPKSLSLQLSNPLNMNVELNKNEELSADSLSSNTKRDLINFLNSEKTSQESIRQSVSSRIKEYSESSQLHFRGNFLHIGAKNQIKGNNTLENTFPDPFINKCGVEQMTSSSDIPFSNGNKECNISKNKVVSNSWKRVCNDDGESFYINLQNGNTSFVPPPPDPVPEWNSRQAMGEPVLKIPITDENDPLGLDKRKNIESSFLLSHDFDAFLANKRKQPPEAVSTSKVKRVSLSGNNTESEKEYCQDTSKTFEKKRKHETDVDIIHKVNKNQAFISSKTDEALSNFLIENFLIDEEISKWGNNQEKNSLCNENNTFADHIKNFWENNENFHMDAEILASHLEGDNQISSYSNIKCYNIIHPYKFTREMLENCKVVGQVDDKFIAIVMNTEATLLNHLIVLVDQHAADERIQLEKVLCQSYEIKSFPNGTRKVLKSERILAPIEATFKEEEVRIMKNFRDQFLEIGLEFTVVNDTKVLFHCLPCYLVAKEPNEKNTRRCQTAHVIVHAVVVEMCENICTLGGSSLINDTEGVRPLPRALIHVTNTIACKSAIKFGDKLSLAECERIIRSLVECKLPFQCAHGRPSLIPIIDLSHVKHKTKVLKPNFRRLHSCISC